MRNLKSILFITLICGFISSAKTQDEFPINTEILDPLAFLSKKINLKNYLIDLRSSEAFAEFHVEGAKNIPFLQSSFKKETENLSLHTPVMIYCTDGEQSLKAARILAKAGFRTIIILDGGIDAWIAHKLKVIQVEKH